jgi:hypothetical protein
MYDHGPCEAEDLGWEEFIARQWESIFTGYRSWIGLRTMGRRWSDFIEAGLGCSPDIADRLVKSGLIDGADRGLQMAAPDVRTDLAEMSDLDHDVSHGLLDQHARLLSFVRAYAYGHDGDAANTGPASAAEPAGPSSAS